MSQTWSVSPVSSIIPSLSSTPSPDQIPLSSQLQNTMEAVVSIVVPVIFGIIVVVGLFGNALVVIVVLCNPQMKSTTNLLIINLAIADLLFIVFCVPFTAWDYAFAHWIFGDIWCRVVQYLIVVCAFASIYTLVLMSFDRFLAVHPIASISIRTQRNASRAIFITWISIISLCIPVIFLHSEHYHKNYDGTPFIQCKFKEDQNQSLYQLVFFLLSFVVPITLIFVLYIFMLKKLWYTNVPGRQQSSESVRSKGQRQEYVNSRKRVTRLVVVVVAVFAGCWFPIQLVLLLKAYKLYQMNIITITIQIVAHVMAYMNSCVNPILYAFLSENFRKAFHKVILCWSTSADRSQLAQDRQFNQSDIDGPGVEMSVVNSKLSKGHSENNII